jgi:DNA-binding SARP family transcriptional activator
VLRINTLGGLSVHADGRALTGSAAQPRRLAVLALLARAGERGVTREKLLSILWPEADDERGRRSLNQTLYAIRKELGSDDAILGLKDLRLNLELVTSDVGEFEEAVASRDLQRAVDLYAGPFIDSFHLPRAPEFQSWVDRERGALAHAYETALERLAAEASKRGDTVSAVRWLRRLASHDPLNARVALLLMQALDAAGDRAGAIRHANVYEVLVEQELDLPPDRDVVALAEQLRRALETSVAVAEEPSGEVESATADRATTPDPVTLAPPRSAPAPLADPADTAQAVTDAVDEAVVEAAPDPIAPSAPSLTREDVGAPRRARGRRVAGLVVAATVVIAATIIGRGVLRSSGTHGRSSVIAVGRIADYRTTRPASHAAPIADMLATNVARARGVQVLSTVRLYEFLRQTGDGHDSTAAALATAARDAGATELVDGALYERADGSLRLDLRRIDLATGDVRGAYTVSGRDVFALTDSGTARLVAELGATTPSGSIADFTTRSLAAYRYYEDGIRAYGRGDRLAASRAFDAAVAEDSTFAMAVYYSSIVGDFARVSDQVQRLRRAVQLAERATERERLIILGDYARAILSPALLAYADSLSTRYPNEVYGPLYRGVAHLEAGEFLEAIPVFERVLASDSLALQGTAAECSACVAIAGVELAYEGADSLDAAERTARRWLRLQPFSTAARTTLALLLDIRGHPAEALATARAGKELDITYDDALTFAAEHHIGNGDFEAADTLLLNEMRSGNERRRSEAVWQLALSHRHQGRLVEALGEAREWRKADDRVSGGTALSRTAVGLEAQILLEQGAYRAAAALFDSVAQFHVPYEMPTAFAFRSAWMLTQSANALAAAGDTVAVARLIDSVRALGELTISGRNRLLHHYVRGLLLTARGDTAGAVSEFRAAIHSPFIGYTRTNLELGRLLVATGRARDAIAILQPALRARLEGSQLYVSRTELHEALARAWDGAGVRDSAVAHYRAVVSAWRRADPPFAPRVRAAQLRLASLGARS